MEKKWTTPEGASQATMYVEMADMVVIERRRTIAMICDIVECQFGKREDISVMDLGCGNGIITSTLRERYPSAQYHLLDGSEKMIEMARENVKGENVSFTHRTFEEYLDVADNESAYDCVFSANAIHHLSLEGKKDLFSKVYRETREGGMFINIDPVLPASAQSEKWQFRLWKLYMDEALLLNGKDEGGFDKLPENYKAATENQPSGLFEQMEAMKQVGFHDVDCFWKYGIFAMFGGSK